MNDALQNLYLEIRSATGGDEAKIWAADLLRMYLRYASRRGWKASGVDTNVIKVSGYQVFDSLKNESGVHRVQRFRPRNEGEEFIPQPPPWWFYQK